MNHGHDKNAIGKDLKPDVVRKPAQNSSTVLAIENRERFGVLGKPNKQGVECGAKLRAEARTLLFVPVLDLRYVPFR